MLVEHFKAKGHPNILCLHESTSEFTCETHLTKKGDCIFAVSSDKSMMDLPKEFKDALRSEDATLKMTIECNGVSDTVSARGHPKLMFTHETDFVVRKSSFTCSRTLAVEADKASSDLDRQLVAELALGGDVVIKLEVT